MLDDDLLSSTTSKVQLNASYRINICRYVMAFVIANATASSNDDPASAYEVRPISTSYPSPSSCNDDDDDDDDDDDGR